MRRLGFSLAMTAAVLCVPSCGGGGGDGDGDTTLTLTTLAAIDGQIQEGTATGAALLFATVGDTDANSSVRGFLSFDLAQIPAGASIVSARIETAQTTFGTPIAALGSILLDHLDLGADLDLSDFGRAAIRDSFAVLSSSDVNGPRTVDVTAQVEEALTLGLPRFDVRLHTGLATDGDAGLDFARFPTGDSSIPSTMTVVFSD